MGRRRSLAAGGREGAEIMISMTSTCSTSMTTNQLASYSFALSVPVRVRVDACVCLCAHCGCVSSILARSVHGVKCVLVVFFFSPAFGIYLHFEIGHEFFFSHTALYILMFLSHFECVDLFSPPAFPFSDPCFSFVLFYSLCMYTCVVLLELSVCTCTPPRS